MDAEDDDINVDAIEVVKGPVALINSTGMDVVCVIENSSTDRKVRGNSPPKINHSGATLKNNQKSSNQNQNPDMKFNIFFSCDFSTNPFQTLPFIAASSSVVITLIHEI